MGSDIASPKLNFRRDNDFVIVLKVFIVQRYILKFINKIIKMPRICFHKNLMARVSTGEVDNGRWALGRVGMKQVWPQNGHC